MSKKKVNTKFSNINQFTTRVIILIGLKYIFQGNVKKEARQANNQYNHISKQQAPEINRQ